MGYECAYVRVRNKKQEVIRMGRLLFLAVAVGLVFLARPVQGWKIQGQQGFDWKWGWTADDSGEEYWDNRSIDGTPPGNIGQWVAMYYSPESPYWGNPSGAPDADTSVWFTSEKSSATAIRVVFAAKMSVLRNYRFGIYKKGDPTVRIQLFDGMEPIGVSRVVRPEWDFGFYLEVGAGTRRWMWYTEARFNSQDTADQHFAFFDVTQGANMSSDSAYVIGVDDVPFTHPWSDRDYQDLVFFIAPVGVEITLFDAETEVSIPGVLLVFSHEASGDSVNVESASQGTVYVPINDNPSQRAQGMLQSGEIYSLQIFPRRYYRRGDGSVVTYLTPAAGSTGGGTDIAIQIDGSYIMLIDKDTKYGWGDVYWQLTTGHSANKKLTAIGGVITLPMYLIPVKLEGTPTNTDVVQYSLDQLVKNVSNYNQQNINENKRVPPHIAYANCMLEIGGEPGLAYVEFQGGYWSTVNDRGVQPYTHAHYGELPNCTEEHTDSGFGYAQLTGLTALGRIRKAENWKKLLEENIKNTRTTAILDLAGLASAEGSIRKMLEILNERYGGKLKLFNNRSQLASWQTAIQNYNPGEEGRPGKAWRWLTSSPPGNGKIKWEIPIPHEKYSEWDVLLKDADYDGRIDELPKPPPVGVD